MAKDPLFTEVPDSKKPAQGKESALPEELQGKSPEELYVVLQAEHNKVLAETLQQKEAPPPAPAAPPAPVAPTAPTVPVQKYVPPTLPADNDAPDILTDPDGFMDVQFQKRVGPLVENQVKSMRASNCSVFQMKNTEDYGKFGEEIEKFVDGLHPQLQINPEAYDRALDFVIGTHRKEIIEEESNKRALTTVAKVLAGTGMNADEVAQVLRSTAGGDGALKVPAVPEKPVGSLFQSNVGVPIVDPLKTTIRSQIPGGNAAKKKRVYHPDEQNVMDAFDMTPEQWDEYADQNTDLISQINRGER